MRQRDDRGRFLPAADTLARFLKFCRFDPETGCVLWAGGKTQGRGHHAPYGSFWAEGRRWFAHRWAAKYIHGHDIDDMQVDHCCSDHVPNLRHPNTLCVQHVQALTPKANRDLQTRRAFIHLQVGLVSYEDAYGPPDEAQDRVPFYTEPSWLKHRGDHMILRDEITGEFAGIGCNTCNAAAPPAEEISRGHGLINMGWYCSGGTHLCPEHAAEGSPISTVARAHARRV